MCIRLTNLNNAVACFISFLVFAFPMASVAVPVQENTVPVQKQRMQDPTRPPQKVIRENKKENEQESGYSLSAIFTRNKQNYAVVNGSVVKKGDQIADMEVTEINFDKLTLKSLDMPKQTKVVYLMGAVDVKSRVKK